MLWVRAARNRIKEKDETRIVKDESNGQKSLAFSGVCEVERSGNRSPFIVAKSVIQYLQAFLYIDASSSPLASRGDLEACR